ncbi:peroxiredoxin [Ectopseudomonas mendocina]|nr:peroxiredoxin [Pseudomonas mendocina]
MGTALLGVGQAAPWFTCPTQHKPRFVFDTVGGRYILLCFFASAGDPDSHELLAGLGKHRQRFDDLNLAFFGVSVDSDDQRLERVNDALPGVRYFWDFDRKVSLLYGACCGDGRYQRVSYVLDPMLRVLAVLPFNGEVAHYLKALARVLDSLPHIERPHHAAFQAPVLVLPRVFEPSLCQALMDYYAARGGEPSGYMQDIDGKTVQVIGQAHKCRRDCLVEDEALREACRLRIYQRLVPQIERAFQFKVSRMERYLIGCYDATEQGHFRPHRDNTTKGTAHRRFAVSLFLNSGEYEGGWLRFPEFGSALYGAPTGGAVVFACSLLHEALPVTRGRRFMFLPFLYDEAAKLIREANKDFLDEGIRCENDAAGQQPKGNE